MTRPLPVTSSELAVLGLAKRQVQAQDGSQDGNDAGQRWRQAMGKPLYRVYKSLQWLEDAKEVIREFSLEMHAHFVTTQTSGEFCTTVAAGKMEIIRQV